MTTTMMYSCGTPKHVCATPAPGRAKMLGVGIFRGGLSLDEAREFMGGPIHVEAVEQCSRGHIRHPVHTLPGATRFRWSQVDHAAIQLADDERG